MGDFAGKHAVIIDDDEFSADVLASLLAKQSISSTVINDSTNMDAVLSSIESPDVIFLDLEMPVHNGYDVLEALQSYGWHEAVPIVAYTTHISHVNQARTAGFHSFLGKPLNRNEFPQQLERIFSGESIWEIP